MRRPNSSDGKNAIALNIILAVFQKNEGDFFAIPASSHAASAGLSTNTTTAQNKNSEPAIATLPNTSKNGFNSPSKTAVPKFPPQPRGQNTLDSPDSPMPP